jgi:hypothetical protein
MVAWLVVVIADEWTLNLATMDEGHLTGIQLTCQTSLITLLSIGLEAEASAVGGLTRTEVDGLVHETGTIHHFGRVFFLIIRCQRVVVVPLVLRIGLLSDKGCIAPLVQLKFLFWRNLKIVLPRVVVQVRSRGSARLDVMC